MKITKLFMVLALMGVAETTFAQSEKDQKVMADANDAKEMLMEPEYGLTYFFDNSKGYAIFPNVGEGALIIGGASGNGVVYEDGNPVGMANLKKIDIGLQAGGQSVLEIIFFEDEAALDIFKDGEYELGAELSATMLKRGAKASTSYSNGVKVFAKPKAGVMADLSVGGQKFEFTPMENMD
ncbi:Hypothetical protein I595_1808 [Croceitalea dokdonensis DOKDO 023]|uniref:Ysc84 actin-binding domain-containing protein n=1 Tax=Croceitalea dokdonensis DOKDO 023 TaxID=1300341 RepID=A0A0P7B231_9FLAO|nr:lipid-binding SYLF domain-containing protein [Croceitalea dokdonensis]KPM32159.1 Hypothetical protein I595_1808 [Croceitalea dokdonensis DOKDO 023]